VAEIGIQLSAEWRMSISLPYRDYDIDAAFPFLDVGDHGIGDITILGSWAPWVAEHDHDHDEPGHEEPDPDAFFDRRRIRFFGGFRLPTGDPDLDLFAGTQGEVVPLGSGTAQLLLGASTNAPIAPRFRLFDALLLTIPLGDNNDEPPPPTKLGSKPAFTVFNRLGVSWTALEWLDLYLALDVQWKDDARGDAVGGDSGKSLAWFTPGVVIHGPSETAFEVSYRTAHELMTIGVSKRF
jgi:hypothetical protein